MVEEELGYQASGDGEHLFLTVRKRGRNTQEVARAIAKLAGVPQVAVGYAGLKDRHAVTTQHFTVQLPGREAPDWSSLEDDSLQILSAQRHHRKIRRGSLRGNRFLIRVAAIQGDRDLAEARLQRILAAGVPNYFGSQRFGHEGQNLARVDELFAGRGRRPNREQRSLLLSAARSHLFNQVLQARVAGNCWDQAIDGDVMVLSGPQRQFMYDPEDATIGPRLAELDIHPTGPLVRTTEPCPAGCNQRAPHRRSNACRLGANGWTASHGFGLDADRRALRLGVTDMRWTWEGDSLELGFSLVAGAYATAVLREIVRETD